ncbi:MAG: WhiB family transcriptional regulator [Actinobacteria bacterium]|nr:WhiB family transcriptional regulator [Actinomycetota bacterium]
MRLNTPYRLSITEPDSRWMDKAACIGMDADIFFPERDGKPLTGGRGIYDKARQVCATCTVKNECLNYAFHFNMTEFGMFGGLSPRERRKQFTRLRNLLKSIATFGEKSQQS